MTKQDKIVLSFLGILIFASHAYFPIGMILGYKMPLGSGLIGLLGTLGALILAGIYLLWRGDK